ncbi:MAG: STAS domain-containing protein [Planctomycetes bacterium]|nr:STAS domain-containing protein [Planctomycetota bacterium]
MTSYALESETVDGTFVARLSGKLDRDAGEALEQLLVAQSPPYVVNLAAVDYLSSSGVAALVKLTATKQIVIASPADCVVDVLSLAGVGPILKIVADERAARESARLS